MAERPAQRRGSYAKGIAKREEILDRALDVIAREGYRGASVKELADAVGLSQAGLLHYFDSKEELFVEILRKRDAVDQSVYGIGPGAQAPDELRTGFIRVMQHNADVPGLVRLYAQMSVEATDPTHPAHDYFTERSRGIRETMAAARPLPASGEPLDPDTFGRVLQAVADGLQVQWLQDPSIDMAGIISALLEALEGGTPAESAAADQPTAD
ncbi:TetR/AcrR family transcriptional regulator [Microbacterium sp. C7(2022)]|uniref:TetR/AcrR family transcriptional regulator n=1 Tax=Microbacterium sp. C7(2022) TaxID=2992759 RepID=UPI00237B81BC|nr:TetR/AcrR family transcriptional regulator [Microbacterium sp. C7(2022)]MDE0546625.1 TetR/AcrR family transcriptional regulator [Microbacterium sp. C7(2022)]